MSIFSIILVKKERKMSILIALSKNNTVSYTQANWTPILK